MSLKKAYEPYFKMGAAVPFYALKDQRAVEELCSQYDSFTCENEMKPMFLLDREENMRHPKEHDRSPAVRFDGIRGILDFAQEHGLKMRGHTLVWHGQTPFWFFREGYADEKDAPLVDRETMLARMESYICSVLTFFEEEYPGLIYAWDVVNEAVNDGDLRQSLWTKVIGEDYILHAFRFARKYSKQGVGLFYNDYTTYEPWKREIICEKILKPLQAEGLIDGMGMQSHLLMDEPAMEEYEKALLTYGALGLQVQVTELDIHNADPSEASMEALAARYKELFSILVRAKKNGTADITNVTLWGLNDDLTWLTDFRKEKSYPLLFTGEFQPKKAYYEVLGVPELIEKE